uniref:Smr domain-containing protein n=1 Tax=Cucumis melo TaxID=3656 RepID=A0A9I9CTK8_CUCME
MSATEPAVLRDNHIAKGTTDPNFGMLPFRAVQLLIGSSNPLHKRRILLSGSFLFQTRWFNSSFPWREAVSILKPRNSQFLENPHVFNNRSFTRPYCSGKEIGNGGREWTEDIEYLDESGSVIFSGKGVRSVEPGVDDHVMVGGLKKPFLNASAVAKIVEVVRRWKWGPELESQLEKLQFVPNMTHITQALKIIDDAEASLSLFRWAKRQSWYSPNDECYGLLFDGLNQRRDFDAIQLLFDEVVRDLSSDGTVSFSAYNRVIQYLAKAEKLEVSFCCFKKIHDSGFEEGSVDSALRWLQFMGSSGIRTNSFIIRQLFESCMKKGMYESAMPLLETYVNSAAKVDLILYTSILAHLVRCQEEQKERYLMSILSATKHRAHSFLCGLFTGTEQRKQPVLSFVREFFQGIDYELEESSAKYFVNVLLNYLILMGQINRARCIWKVAYENKLFPKAIVFDQHIAWSLDVRNLSVGAALIAVVHTLHRFRKRMLYYGIVPRRIKLVTGPTLKLVIAQMLSSVESPFEVSKVVLRATGDSVMEWFKKPIVQQFLLNEIPSRSDILMHKLNTLFPSSAPEIRSLSPPKPLISRNSA